MTGYLTLLLLMCFWSDTVIWMNLFSPDFAKLCTKRQYEYLIRSHFQSYGSFQCNHSASQTRVRRKPHAAKRISEMWQHTTSCIYCIQNKIMYWSFDIVTRLIVGIQGGNRLL